jgi:hypothetical protein
VDVYTFSHAKRDFSIYGMEFKGSTQQSEQTCLPVLLKFPDHKCKANFLNHLPILFDLENHNHFQQSRILEVNELELIAEGEPKWLFNCLTVSFYTFLLRALCYQFETIINNWKWILEFRKLTGTDPKYAQSISEQAWERILNDLEVLRAEGFCGFDAKNDDIRPIHHNSGFISVFGWHSELSPARVRSNKHWQLIKAKGIPLYTN